MGNMSKLKDYRLPIYFPDATRAVVKGLDTQDLKDCGVEGVVVNTYHLMTEPGSEFLEKIGGVKKYMNFDGLVISDSGGWQVFSLIHRANSPKTYETKITDDGVIFGVGKKGKEVFTPEKSMEVQFQLGSDIKIVLDDFTDPKATKQQVKKSIERTVLWAKRAKEEFEKQCERRGLVGKDRPLIFAVIQGGEFMDLRKRCAEELIEIGFDGYGFGGYPVDENGEIDLEISEYTAKLIPDNKYKFALGVGRPWDIAALAEMGWQIFDCTLPTRDARHKRIYKYTGDMTSIKDITKAKFEYIYIDRAKHLNNLEPLQPGCDCHTCMNYSASYISHLFRIGDTSAYRLASIHNLRVYTKIIESLRSQNADT